MPYEKGKHAHLFVPISARDLLKRLAKYNGRTMQGHVEALIVKDAKKEGFVK